jgi:hypothetical protein
MLQFDDINPALAWLKIWLVWEGGRGGVLDSPLKWAELDIFDVFRLPR